MELLTLNRVLAVLDGLETGGYKNFLNYSIVRYMVEQPDNILAQMYTAVLKQRPTMDIVTLVCTMAGALHYTATNLLDIDKAVEVFNCREQFDSFVRKNYAEIQQLALSRRTNSTIPQRAFPLACFLPNDDSEIGLLELGCSRGDMGLVLQNLELILAHSSKYLFPNFRTKVHKEKLQYAKSIKRYFGVDLDISVDDAWLLALWGLEDDRRKQLVNFYGDFKPNETLFFYRLQADACKLMEYITLLQSFFADSNVIVILTSFMLYQLSLERRLSLFKTIQMITCKLSQKEGSQRSVLWFNQGIAPQDLLSGTFDYARCYFSRLWFEDGALVASPIARLFNDACEGWEELVEPLVFVHKPKRIAP